MAKFLIIPKTTLIFSLPVLLLLTNLYVMTSYQWFRCEYNIGIRINSDYRYYSDSQHLELAKATLHYIHSDESTDFLRGLKINGFPIYTEREIAHLLEVKNLMQRFFSAHLIVLIAGILSILILFIHRVTRQRIPLYVLKGCLLAGIILGVFFVAEIISWNRLFLLFHRIFFSQANYSFPYSYTIIQLFPPRFWFTTALVWQILTLIETLIIASFMFWMRKKFPGGAGLASESNRGTSL